MTDKLQQEVDAREAKIATDDFSAIPANLDFASAADLAVLADGYDMSGSARRCSVILNALTHDNPHLSRLTTGADEVEIGPLAASNVTHLFGSFCAINIAPELAASVQAYVEAGIAPATRRAYRADLDHLAAWGGVIPSTDAQLAAYIAAHATALALATLVRRLAAISVAHEAHGLSNPVRSHLVRATMRGIRQERGSAQRQAKPLFRDDLLAVLAGMGGSLRAIRDRALLLIGFAGGFRRSELCGVDCTDIERVRRGVIVTIRRSKTDQEGAGRKIGIPHGRSKWCPTTALEAWLEAAGIGMAPFSGASIVTGGYRPNACRPKLSASSSASASRQSVTIRPAIPATACAPGSPPAPLRLACRCSKSGARPAMPATLCSPATSATASCSSTTPLGRCSKSKQTTKNLAGNALP